MTDYALWAPRKQAVDVVVGDARHPLTKGPDGWWRGDVDTDPQAPYAFSIDQGDPRPDPRGLRLADGVHGPTTPFDVTAFDWTDGDWAGRPLRGSVVYEVHVGTFTPGGTLDSAIAKLDYLADLGVTTVELMPLNSFPGEHNWGYDGVGLYAVDETYGGPAALQRFVDAAHGKGLAVCLDVVYNHLGPDGNYLGEIAPYFTELHHTPWGAAVNLDGPDSDEVRRFLIDNALLWLRDFHLDALRLDAVHALIDERAVPILEELAAAVDALSEQVGRPLVLIAEDDRNDVTTTSPRGSVGTAGGLGITGQWTDDIHHALHVALTGETDGYYADFAEPGALAKVFTNAFFHDGTFSTFRGRGHGRPVDRASIGGHRFVASLQTHDQVGNRRTGDRLAATVPEGRLAAGAALLLTSAFTPMLFMGEEWAASTPWQFFTDHLDPALAEAVRRGRAAEFASHGWGPDEVPDPQHRGTLEASRLDWAELEQPAHARMHDWYQRLLALRRAEPDLQDDNLAAVELDFDDDARVGVLTRGRLRTVVSLADGAATAQVPSGSVVVERWDDSTDVDPSGAVTFAGPGAVVVRVP